MNGGFVGIVDQTGLETKIGKSVEKQCGKGSRMAVLPGDAVVITMEDLTQYFVEARRKGECGRKTSGRMPWTI